MSKLIDEMLREKHEEALAEGREEGRMEVQLASALRMVKAGVLPAETISEYLNLPIEQVKKLMQAELQGG